MVGEKGAAEGGGGPQPTEGQGQAPDTPAAQGEQPEYVALEPRVPSPALGGFLRCPGSARLQVETRRPSRCRSPPMPRALFVYLSIFDFALLVVVCYFFFNKETSLLEYR